MREKIDHIYVFYADDFLDYFFNQLDTPATAQLFCSVYATACNFLEVPAEGCLVAYDNLLLFTGGSYVDGDSRGCRMLHGVFAASGLPFAAELHCPHISFTEAVDPKGVVKCQVSEGVLPTDLFTNADFAFWESFKVTIGFQDGTSFHFIGDTNTGVDCPRGCFMEDLDDAFCKALCRDVCDACETRYELGINPVISDTIQVCVPEVSSFSTRQGHGKKGSNKPDDYCS